MLTRARVELELRILLANRARAQICRLEPSRARTSSKHDKPSSSLVELGISPARLHP
ncbi:hypothetical protein Hanom_Chr06g00533181 [Helianthus anomalus]